MIKQRSKSILQICLLSTAFIAGTGCSTIPAKSPHKAQTCIPNKIQSGPVTNLLGQSIRMETIDAFLADRMTERDIPGLSFAIINDGAIVFHRNMGSENATTGSPVTPCTLFQGASITKPLFGNFVMTFVEDGTLDLDRPLYEYLPNRDIAHDERYKEITARMVLTHQTGFPNWRTDYPDKRLFIQFDPGTDFHYSGEGYEYLADVLMQIAEVDDDGLEALFQVRVAQPLGLNQTFIIASQAALERTAYPHSQGKLATVKVDNSFADFGAAYGVHSEAIDFSKWLIALMNGDGLPEALLSEYFKPQSVPIPAAHEGRALGLSDYGLGFAIYDTPLGQLHTHSGNNPGYSSMVAIQRDQKWGFALFTNANQQSELGLELFQFLNRPVEK